MKLKHFKSAADFRQWLEANHASANDLWVGFFKKHSGKGGITYAEALDEALCFGWIDGVRKRVDELSFMQRFTPRQPTSNWSLINTAVDWWNRQIQVQEMNWEAFGKWDWRWLPMSNLNRQGKTAMYWFVGYINPVWSPSCKIPRQ